MNCFVFIAVAKLSWALRVQVRPESDSQPSDWLQETDHYPTLGSYIVVQSAGKLTRQRSSRNRTFIKSLGALYPSRTPSAYCRQAYSPTFIQKCEDFCNQQAECQAVNQGFGELTVEVASSGIFLRVHGPARPRIGMHSDKNDVELVCDDEIVGVAKGPVIVPIYFAGGWGNESEKGCVYTADLIAPLAGEYVVSARVNQLGGLQHLHAGNVITKVEHGGMVDCEFKSYTSRQQRFPTNQSHGWVNLELGAVRVAIGTTWPSTLAACESAVAQLDGLWVHHSSAAKLRQSCSNDLLPDLDPRDDYIYSMSPSLRMRRMTVDEALQGKRVAFIGDSTLEEIIRHWKRGQYAHLASSVLFKSVWGIYDKAYGQGYTCLPGSDKGRQDPAQLAGLVKQWKPDVVVINEGAHDIAKLAPDQFESAVHSLLAQIRRHFSGRLIFITLNRWHNTKCPGMVTKDGKPYDWNTEFSWDAMHEYVDIVRKVAGIYKAFVLDSFQLSLTRPEGSRDGLHQDMSNVAPMSREGCDKFLQGDWTAALGVNGPNMSPTRHPDSIMETKAQILLNMIHAAHDKTPWTGSD